MFEVHRKGLQAKHEEVNFNVGDRTGRVSGLVVLPETPSSGLILAHGAGAGMRHRTMEAIVAELSSGGIATFRYQFPYMERGARRPDPPAVLIATVRAAVEAAAEFLPGLPLFAGGKSMGGRMTSSAAASDALPGVMGLIFFGFPLHAAKQPSTNRAQHITKVTLPMLFLQGTRDTLADIGLITEVVETLGARATLHVLEGADHSFHVLKSSGRTDAEVLAEIGQTVSSWTRSTLGLSNAI